MTDPDVHAAIEQIHDALDAANAGYHDRDSGVIDLTSGELAAALLQAGWVPPEPVGGESSLPGLGGLR